MRPQEHRRHQVRPTRLHELNALIVQLGAMFDRVDASPHRLLDPNGPVRMRRYRLTEPLRFSDQRLQLFVTVLAAIGIGPHR